MPELVSFLLPARIRAARGPDRRQALRDPAVDGVYDAWRILCDRGNRPADPMLDAAAQRVAVGRLRRRTTSPRRTPDRRT